MTFWGKFDKSAGPAGCWLWLGSKRNGYGRIEIAGTVWRVHRYAWTLTNGPIPTGAQVLHSCDNPACGNPSHLFLGDRYANMRDMASKGRGKTVWRKLTEQQAREIIALTGKMSFAAIGRIYGVHYDTISRIQRGETWSHIPRSAGIED